jgi:hypothetical protein
MKTKWNFARVCFLEISCYVTKFRDSNKEFHEISRFAILSTILYSNAIIKENIVLNIVCPILYFFKHLFKYFISTKHE